MQPITATVWSPGVITTAASSGAIGVAGVSSFALTITATSTLAGTLTLCDYATGVAIPGFSATLNASSPVIFEDIDEQLLNVQLVLSGVTGSGAPSAVINAKV